MPHAVSCRVLQVSGSWFCKWRDRPPTPRRARRAELADQIRKFFNASGGTYGSPRITLDLRDAGWTVSENTVAALMVELGLAGRVRKKRRNLTKPGRRSAAADHVRRKFTAVAPDVLWCGDLTEIVTDEGKLIPVHCDRSVQPQAVGLRDVGPPRRRGRHRVRRRWPRPTGAGTSTE